MSSTLIQQELHLTFRYSVHFTSGVFDRENTILRDVIASRSEQFPAKAVFVIDSGVHQNRESLLHEIESYCFKHSDVLRLSAPPVILPGGEAAKNDPAHVEKILDAINDGGICRHSYVIVIGGGAVIDVAGYAAAIAHRGVRLIRIPTTVLSQDDSAVGVKNSVNAFGKKNFLGTFAVPVAVINDFTFLTTLSDRDWRSGVSEAIKVGLIRDAAFFRTIENQAVLLANRDLAAMETIVRRCAELHLAHIATSGDPFEMGTSRPLDFGHWAAHKLEYLTGYKLRHGEAVAIGIALDSTYSHLSGLLARESWQRIIDLLIALGFSIHVPELSVYSASMEHPRCVLRGLTEFREHLGGKLTIALLKNIGVSFDAHEIDHDLMIQSIEILKNIEASRIAGAKTKQTVHTKTAMETLAVVRDEVSTGG